MPLMTGWPPTVPCPASAHNPRPALGVVRLGRCAGERRTAAGRVSAGGRPTALHVAGAPAARIPAVLLTRRGGPRGRPAPGGHGCGGHGGTRGATHGPRPGA